MARLLLLTAQSGTSAQVLGSLEFLEHRVEVAPATPGSLLRHPEADLVLVDAPPVLPVTDSTLLATSVDGTVLVVKHAKTRREHVEVARDMLAKVQANVIGVVLNGTPAKGVGSDYYGGGYGASHQAYDAYLDAPATARSASGRRKDQRPLRRSRG